MSIRKITLDPQRQKRLEEKNKNRKSSYQGDESDKNRNIPKADIDMLVLDKYERKYED